MGNCLREGHFVWSTCCDAGTGTVLCWNMASQSPSDTVSHPKSPECLVTEAANWGVQGFDVWCVEWFVHLAGGLWNGLWIWHMVWNSLCIWRMVCGTVCAFDIQFCVYVCVCVCVCMEWFVHLTYDVWNGLCIWHKVCAFDVWCVEWFVHLTYGLWNGLCIWHMVCVCGTVCAFVCLLSAIRETVLN